MIISDCIYMRYIENEVHYLKFKIQAICVLKLMIILDFDGIYDLKFVSIFKKVESLFLKNSDCVIL